MTESTIVKTEKNTKLLVRFECGINGDVKEYYDVEYNGACIVCKSKAVALKVFKMFVTDQIGVDYPIA